MNAEEFLASRLRIKIFRMLLELGELNASEIARRLSVNYVTTSMHLRILENEGMVKQKRFGRIRLYRLNEQSAKCRALRNLLECWQP